MKVHLQALGCRLNEAELETWSKDFRKKGHQIAGAEEPADLMILNTCAVTSEAVRKSRKLISRLHKENPEAKLVISGCHASLSPTEVAQTLGVDLVISNEDKDRLVELTTDKLDLPVMPEIATEPGDHSLFKRGRQRAFVKVQDGCRYRCSYCIVTVARGEERSRPINEILAEVKDLYASGIQEVVITGVQLGGYGNGNNSSLAELLQALLDHTDIPRIRLGSVEPWAVDRDVIPLFANPRLMPHLHLPLQSGSDPVLRRMARMTRVDSFHSLVSELRTQIPHFNLTTDIIVGFPGETDEQWAETMDHVAKIGFGHIHIFSYSDRQGTKAAGLSDKIPNAIKRQRSRELHDLAATMKTTLLEAQIGKTVNILWEGSGKTLDDGTMLYQGYAPGYFRVHLIDQPGLGLENTISPVTLTGLNETRDTALGKRA